MSLASEFKEFVNRGNVMDLAVGVIIGGAFGKIVSSLVEDVLMPVIGLVSGGINFSALAVGTQAGPDLLKYGKFVQSVIDFLIVAFVIFMLVRSINSMRKPAEAAPAPGPTADQKLLTEIRDLLARGTVR